MYLNAQPSAAYHYLLVSADIPLEISSEMWPIDPDLCLMLFRVKLFLGKMSRFELLLRHLRERFHNRTRCDLFRTRVHIMTCQRAE